MARKDGINGDEMKKLVAVLKATGKWEEAKAALPGVDGALLDRGFKAWAMKQAGLEALPQKSKVDPLK